MSGMTIIPGDDPGVPSSWSRYPRCSCCHTAAVSHETELWLPPPAPARRAPLRASHAAVLGAPQNWSAVFYPGMGDGGRGGAGRGAFLMKIF